MCVVAIFTLMPLSGSLRYYVYISLQFYVPLVITQVQFLVLKVDS